MFPCTDNSYTKSSPAVLPWQKKAMTLENPEPQKTGTRAHSPKPPFIVFSWSFCPQWYSGSQQCPFRVPLCNWREGLLDERQITRLICARLKYDLYDFFRGCFGAFYTRKRTGSRPKTPPEKSYRSYLRRAQIRWVIWRSSIFWKKTHKP